MTYQQAALIVHNPDAYTHEEVMKAAAHILGTLGAKPDDVTAAMLAA